MKFVFYSTISCSSPGSTLYGHINSRLKLGKLDVGQTGVEKGSAVGKAGIAIQQSLFYKLKVCQLYISISIHAVFSSWIQITEPFLVPISVKQETNWSFTYKILEYLKSILRFKKLDLLPSPGAIVIGVS